MTANEEWRPIPSLDGRYEISSRGRVRTVARVGIDKNGRRYPIRARIKRAFISAKTGPREIVGFTGGHQRFVHDLAREVFVGELPKVDIPDLPGEEWRPVVGNSGYEVSNRGRVRSLDRSIDTKCGPQLHHGQMLELDWRNGYAFVGIAGRTRRVHKLVAEAFIGPCPSGQYVCHNDGNPANNLVENLRYDTPTGNSLDRSLHGTDHNRNKKTCRLGHLLQAPNLRGGRYEETGHRTCRACHRASAWKAKRPGVAAAEVAAEADRQYTRLLAGVVNREVA